MPRIILTSVVLVYVIALHVVCVAWLFAPPWAQRISVLLGRDSVRETRSYHQLSIPPQLRHESQLPAGSTVMLGDSIVEGWFPIQTPWPFVNYGIGGDTTADIVSRLSYYKRLDEAEVIGVAVGVNDLGGYSQASIIAHYTSLLEKLPSAVAVVVFNVLPVDERVGQFVGYNQRIRELNRDLEVLVAGCERCVWVDMTDTMVDGSGHLSAVLHSGDGLHLSAKGYKLWGKQVLQALSNARKND